MRVKLMLQGLGRYKAQPEFLFSFNTVSIVLQTLQNFEELRFRRDDFHPPLPSGSCFVCGEVARWRCRCQ